MEDYALLLLIARRHELQKNIKAEDLEGLEDWHRRTTRRIRSLDAAIAVVSNLSPALSEMTEDLQALQQRLDRFKRIG